MQSVSGQGQVFMGFLLSPLNRLRKKIDSAEVLVAQALCLCVFVDLCSHGDPQFEKNRTGRVPVLLVPRPPKPRPTKRICESASAENGIKPLLCAALSLHAPALRHPFEKSAQLFSLTPDQVKKFRPPQRMRVAAEKSFQAPANVRAGPRAQPVALCRDPVVAQRDWNCGDPHAG